jgi:hypothetical protein
MSETPMSDTHEDELWGELLRQLERATALSG